MWIQWLRRYLEDDQPTSSGVPALGEADHELVRHPRKMGDEREKRGPSASMLRAEQAKV